MHPERCETNIAGREEDCGRHVAFHACGQAAHFVVEQTGIWAHRGAYSACEDHAREAIENGDRVLDAITGDEVALDDDGEIRRAA